jgi:hypothetical protein
MRPTNFCHLYDLRVPVPRAFPAPCATFIAGTPPSFEGAACAARGVLGSVRTLRGTECFTTLATASADRNETHTLQVPRAVSHRFRAR